MSKAGQNDNIDMIQEIIQTGNPDVLQRLYSVADDVMTQRQIMKLWYGITPISRCTTGQIDWLSKHLLNRAPISDGVSEIRQRFIDEEGLSVASKRNAKLLFTKMAPFEMKAGCDFALFPPEDLYKALGDIGIYSRAYLRILLSGASKYMQWLREHGHPIHADWGPKPKFQIDRIDLSGAMAQCCFRDPMDLYSRLSRYVPMDNGYMGPMVALLSWMRFETSELASLRNEDVNLEEGTIRGRKVPEVFMPALRSYMSLSIVTRPTYSGAYDSTGRVKTMHLVDIGFFLKRVAAADDRRPIAALMCVRMLDAIGIQHQDIVNSAKYYEMWELDQRGALNVDEIARIWGMPAKRSSDTVVYDRLSEFQVFRQVFYYPG